MAEDGAWVTGARCCRRDGGGKWRMAVGGRGWGRDSEVQQRAAGRGREVVGGKEVGAGAGGAAGGG
ncbi:hypothetical protein GCM10017687_07820 [Streptomyces echinatus]